MPKKQKSKLFKKSSKNKQGININIKIDQSKKSSNRKPSSSKKPLTGYKPIPPYSSILPQGATYLGAHIPLQNIQQPTYNQPSITELGKEVFNNLMLESKRRENSAYGFGGFQSSTSQINQLHDGIYTTQNNRPIILQDYNQTSEYVDENVFDDPTTNNIITYNKLENKGQKLPSINENSIVELNAEERRDNDLDNLVLQEKKSSVEKQVDKGLDEELIEEEDIDLTKSFSDIRTKSGQEQRLLELSLEEKEKRIAGTNLTPDKKRYLKVNFNIPEVPSRSASNQELKDYITTLNRIFDTDYSINFKGKDAKEKLFRTIRLALITEYDNYT
jgi:hypothetical protein